MSLARLLAVVVLGSLSCLPALAQAKSGSEKLLAKAEISAVAATDAQQQAMPAFPNNLDRFEGQPFKIDNSGTIVPTHPAVFMPMPPLETQMADAGACYSIRSYVVARDSKGSDATHLVGYSTCRPANRYRVWKTAQPNAVQLTR
ncbi:MAG TPA: hypothetical protein VJQ59_07710 [Candidatus Sulfotelmatobacter sp.]|nr:hypothetical protein [Candidatus Sulfotelmatobacter sp.]